MILQKSQPQSLKIMDCAFHPIFFLVENELVEGHLINYFPGCMQEHEPTYTMLSSVASIKPTMKLNTHHISVLFI